MKSCTIFLDLSRRRLSFVAYSGPLRLTATFCQVHHGVHGRDPWMLVPGFFRILSLMDSTVSDLSKSSAVVIRWTETFANSSEILPRLESCGVQISINFPQPGNLLEGLVREGSNPFHANLILSTVLSTFRRDREY